MHEPLYRVTFDPASLLREHPPQFRHPHKAALFGLAYPDGAREGPPVEVTRWIAHVDQPLKLPRQISSQVWADFYDYEPAGDESWPACVEWHVNFADPRLFVAYGSGLFAQDEMQVAEHPALACVREALLAQGVAAKTSDETGPTPILVRNVERRIEVATDPNAKAGRPMGLYGNRFSAAPIEVVRNATRRINPPTITNLIAIAAPSGGSGEYTDPEITNVFSTAYTAFVAARAEGIRASGEQTKCVIHTGFWGCGAFGGNRKLMIALQSLAARAARIDHLVLFAGDKAGADEAHHGLDVADSLAQRCGKTCSLETLVERTSILAYRWGVSDGN